MKRLLLFFILILFITKAFTQTDYIIISGRVISFEESFPIEGVAVQIKGTSNITGTMIDGAYSLKVRPLDSVLVFSAEGYEVQEIKLKPDTTEYNAVLKSTVITKRGIDRKELETTAISK